MSSYFDKFNRQVRELSQETRGNDEAFLKGLMELEKPLVRTCELFAGDRDTPEDIRKAVIGCILTNEVRYEGGDFLGSHVGGVLLESDGAQYACACRSSKLSQELHSLFHDIASRRIQTRYGLVMDDPEAAVKARDAYAESRFGKSSVDKS